MKRALIVIASVGILAVTVATENAIAQVTRPLAPPQTPFILNGLREGQGLNGLRAGKGLNGLPAGQGLNGLPAGEGRNRLGAPPTLVTPDSPAASLGNNQWIWKWP
jgi:hypothetical protein